MKEKLRAIFKGPAVIHPVLFAAFPILFLYAYNISQTSVSQIWLPLGISVGAAVVLWGVLTRLLHSRAKAGVATAIFLGLFFSYGRMHNVLAYQGLVISSHYFLLPATLAVWAACVYLIRRTKSDLPVTTRLLNVVAVAVIAINLINIASYEVGQAGAEAEMPAESAQQPVAGDPDPGTLPDIYLIIPDEYAHPDTMLQYYDYDVGWFFEGLEDRGFFIAHESETPTGSTDRALAGVLNMEHIDGEPSADRLYRMIAYNSAAEFLRARGYEFIYFGTGHDFGRWYTYMQDSADRYFNYQAGAAAPWISEFQEILWNTTMLKPFYYHVVGSQYETAWRRSTLSTLEHLKELPREEGPRFVVAHMMCPHEPFVFGPEGQHVSEVNWGNYRDRQFYLGQYIFISRQLEEVVDSLLRESEIPPIIILQSDHGLRAHHRGVAVGPDEWSKILNAMYLPGMDYSEIPESISPVNTFRLIFNHYFGTDYELLPDD